MSGTGVTSAGTSRLPAGWVRLWSVYLAFVALVLFDLAVTPGFRNPAVIRSLLFESAPVILIGLGQSLAIGTRGIDLSVGSVMALSSAVIGVTLAWDPVGGQATSMALGIGAGLCCGLLNGLLIAFLRIDPLISSLSLLVAARGLAQALLGGARADLPFDGAIPWLGAATVSVLPVTALLALAIAVLFSFIVRRTTFGHYAIFAGASRTASFLAGQPVRATLVFVYGLSGLLAGIAGLFATARLGAADPNYIGVQFELDAIAASVIGGTPLSGGRVSTIGTVFGVLLLEVLDASFIMNNVNSTYAQILKAGFIIAALYLQRAGG
ncbi:ABC transporter permease [Lichenicoccus sp.]|uniref:ABC transporter permease n=1 Tax=Lichenicoccus sp. TaxID=2781899 RepID=UPI003D0E506A